MEIIIQEGDSVIKLTEEELKNVNGGGFVKVIVDLVKHQFNLASNEINKDKPGYRPKF